MFLKGSRYRRLPQSSSVTGAGDILNGVDVRFIPPTGAQFLHTVSGHDRLDLLAFKYYSDARRWWLIADANRTELEHPVDLLDTRPFVEEELALTHPDFLARGTRLLAVLGRLGKAQLGSIGPDGAPAPDPFGTVVVVRYQAATTRPVIIQESASAGFRLVSSFAWADGLATVESFALTDPSVTRGWSDLVARLGSLAGVRRVDSLAAGQRLHLTYNTALVARAELVGQIERAGFAVVPERSRVLERVGAKILIPPNQAP